MDVNISSNISEVADHSINTLIDPVKITDDFLNESDWRVHENSNQSKNIGSLILHQAGTVTAAYWLNKVYTEDVAMAHKSCDIHLHDLCFGKDARFILADKSDMSFAEAEAKGITSADIISYNIETKKCEIEKAVNICKRGINRELIQIMLEDGTLLPLCEPTHLFLTNKGYVEAQNLSDDDDILDIHLSDLTF
jgi:hypothetical protein